MTNLLSPKEIEIDGIKLIISKFPAIAGREIVSQYMVSATPKLGEYKRNEELALKLMSYVGVVKEGIAPIMLTTQALIDNHISTEYAWETLLKIEMEMMKYNCHFFQKELIRTIYAGFVQKLPAWILKILTDLSGQLSRMEKQP